MSKILGLLVGLAFFAVLGGIIPLNNAYGLSCDSANTTESLKYADVVFYGKAVSKEYVPSEHDKKRQDAIVQFSVIESFKGITERQVSVISEEWLWGFNFTKGIEYVVFAGKNNDGALCHQECSPTGTLEYVDINELRDASQQYIMPPLQQLAAGINIDEIKCRHGLFLVTKLSDGSPACVKEETKAKLIGMEWVKTQVDVHNDSAFIESTKNLDAVQTFLSQHPNAKVNVDDEWYTVIYEVSGFKKHPSSQIIYHIKRLIINLDYVGKPKAYLAECGGGGVTLSGPVEPLANPDWCFPLDQSQFSNVTSNMKKSHAKNTSEPYTTIEISFGNITATKLLPVVFSEITHNAEYMNEILVWNFELIGHNADDGRKTWDVTPEDQRIFYKITDEDGTNVIDSTRMPDNLDIPADLHLYSMDCGLFHTIEGESAHPTVFAVKKGIPTIIAKNSNKGILPISDGKYSFEFASMFETTVKLPKNAEIISQESKQCKLVQGIEGDPDRTYTDGHYTKMVFRLES